MAAVKSVVLGRRQPGHQVHGMHSRTAMGSAATSAPCPTASYIRAEAGRDDLLQRQSHAWEISVILDTKCRSEGRGDISSFVAAGE